MRLYLRIYTKAKAMIRYVKRKFLILYRTHRLGYNVYYTPIHIIIHTLITWNIEKKMIITIIIELALFTHIQYR